MQICKYCSSFGWMGQGESGDKNVSIGFHQRSLWMLVLILYEEYKKSWTMMTPLLHMTILGEVRYIQVKITRKIGSESGLETTALHTQHVYFPSFFPKISMLAAFGLLSVFAASHKLWYPPNPCWTSATCQALSGPLEISQRINQKKSLPLFQWRET